MRRRFPVSAALAAIACTTLAACSSSGSGGSNQNSTGASTGGSSSGSTIKIGVVSDLTGVASSGFITNNKGVDAFLKRVNSAGGINGHKIEYVSGDTTSTPQGALTAVQKLVQNDKVFAIVENSSFFFGAEPYALKQGIPVVGTALDGPIWIDPRNTNLFAASGPNNPDFMLLAQGQYMKREGATRCASIGYSSSVSSQKSATGFVKSCQAAGLKKGYINNQVPFGSTDVGPIALAMKNAHVDGLYLPIDPNTAFALIGALHQLGVKMKSVLLATGYGGDLLASKAAVQAAQGVDFSTIGPPAEANTPATKRRAADLAKVGVTGPPTFAEMESYLAMTAFADGLKAAGPNPTRESFMKALDGIKNYDADGLLAPDKINFHDFTPKSRCMWVARLTGQKFIVVPGTPICAPTQKFSG